MDTDRDIVNRMSDDTLAHMIRRYRRDLLQGPLAHRLIATLHLPMPATLATHLISAITMEWPDCVIENTDDDTIVISGRPERHAARDPQGHGL